MGAPLEDWVATVLAHPLKFKFEGLDGFHTTIQEAYANDDDQRQKVWDDADESEREYLDKVLDEGECDELERLEGYASFLSSEVPVGSLDKADLEFIAAHTDDSNLDDDDYRKAIEILERACGTGQADHHRYMFSTCDRNFEMECMESADTDWLFEQFPLTEAYTSAGQYGIPVEEVAFICPSCNSEPHSIDTLNDMGGHFYCGLCGAEHTPDSGDQLDLGDPYNLYVFAKALGVKLYPLTQWPHLRSQVDPDFEGKTGHGVYFHKKLERHVERINKEIFEDNAPPDILDWPGIPQEKGIYDVVVYGVTARAYLWVDKHKMGMVGLVVSDDDEEGNADAKSKWEEEPVAI